MTACLITTGGTIGGRSIYNENRSAYSARDLVHEYLTQNYPNQKIDHVQFSNKDSLSFTDDDIAGLAKIINESAHEKFIVTHGTDTAIVTGRHLKKLIQDNRKTVLITGAFLPLSVNDSDGEKNLADCLANDFSPGVWLVFEGGKFDPDKTDKRFDSQEVENAGGHFYGSDAERPDEYYRKTGPEIFRATSKTYMYKA